jgi:hypothetical protein
LLERLVADARERGCTTTLGELPMCIYGNGETRQWFEAACRTSGKKPDIGQGCMRFRKLDDLPLDVIGKAIAMVPVAK